MVYLGTRNGTCRVSQGEVLVGRMACGRQVGRNRKERIAREKARDRVSFRRQGIRRAVRGEAACASWGIRECLVVAAWEEVKLREMTGVRDPKVYMYHRARWVLTTSSARQLLVEVKLAQRMS